MRRVIPVVLLAGALAFTASPAQAQDSPNTLIEVGQMAPDFELPGATRYGALAEAVKLSDFRGKTVVLPFFFRVRTRG